VQSLITLPTSTCQHRPTDVAATTDPLDADLHAHCRDCGAALVSVLRHVGDDDRVPTWGPWKAQPVPAA